MVLETDTDLDIADRDAVSRFIVSERPTHIFNSAAYTRVDDAETEQELAYRVNATGAGALAQAAAERGCHLLHVSTDYVFDGEARVPYPETAHCAPKSVYGKSKLAGECLVLDSIGTGRSVLIVRTSWLFGEHGPNFVRTILNLLATREELRVVADQVGRPTYAQDLADAGLRLLGLHVAHRTPATSGIYHFANSGETSWHRFACAIRDGARARSMTVAAKVVTPIETEEFPRPAPRPSYSVLATDRYSDAVGQTPRSWQEGLDTYLDRIKDSPTPS